MTTKNEQSQRELLKKKIDYLTDEQVGFLYDLISLHNTRINDILHVCGMKEEETRRIDSAIPVQFRQILNEMGYPWDQLANLSYYMDYNKARTFGEIKLLSETLFKRIIKLFWI